MTRIATMTKIAKITKIGHIAKIAPIAKIAQSAQIAQIAKKAMLGDAAQGLMEETGARVYWQDANESSARIATDRKKLAELNAMLK